MFTCLQLHFTSFGLVILHRRHTMSVLIRAKHNRHFGSYSHKHCVTAWNYSFPHARTNYLADFLSVSMGQLNVIVMTL